MTDAEKPGWHPIEWGAEFVGTALLLLGGLSAVVLDFGHGSPVAAILPDRSARLLLTGILFGGTGSLVAISPLGRLSGAHLNPAVTLAFWIAGHVHSRDLAGYWIAQVLGGLLGALMVALVWTSRASSVRDGITLPAPGLNRFGAAGIEALMTALLILTIFAFTARHRTMRWTPVAVWVLIAILVWVGAPFTGASLNPARSLGPAVVERRFDSIWVYFAGPLLGAAAAACLSRAAGGRLAPLTAKLFHDWDYPSVFKKHPPPTG